MRYYCKHCGEEIINGVGSPFGVFNDNNSIPVYKVYYVHLENFSYGHTYGYIPEIDMVRYSDDKLNKILDDEDIL